MIFYIVLLAALAWPSSRCEPPINSYLPPLTSGPSGPSQNGLTGRNSGIAKGGSQSGGLLAHNSQDSYSNRQNGPSIDTQYGPPSAKSNGKGSQGFGSPLGGFSQGKGNAPNSQYGAPGQNNGGSSRSSNGFSKLESERRIGNEKDYFESGSSDVDQGPQTSYGPPPTGFRNNGPASQRLTTQGAPDSSQSTFGSSSGVGRLGGSLSSTYGAPRFEGFGGNPDGGFRDTSSGRSQNYEEAESNEPVKYEFSYDVDDSQTGTKFGHSEQRDGNLATGEYNVVLPDGRKQVVEYQAGTQGYKPQIRYEGGVNGGSGSGSGRGLDRQGGSLGYTQSGVENGFPGSEQDQGVYSARYQDATEFGDRNSNSLGFMGYPSGRNGKNGAGARNSGQGQSGSQISPSTGLENLNGAQGNGYPSGGPVGKSADASGRDRNSLGNNGNHEGYIRGGPNGQVTQGNRHSAFPGGQNGGRGQQGSQSGENEGYPRGGPSGPRGSGY